MKRRDYITKNVYYSTNTVEQIQETAGYQQTFTKCKSLTRTKRKSFATIFDELKKPN